MNSCRLGIFSKYSAHSSIDTNPDAAAEDWNDIRNEDDEDELTTTNFEITTTKILLETEKDIILVTLFYG